MTSIIRPTRPASLSESLYKPRRRWLRFLAGAAIAVIVLLALYYLLVNPWMSTWGALANEITAPLPGDELVPNPVSQVTMGITIHATPDKIYPWLLQLGVDRGGMYTYDWIENLAGLNVHTIDYIDPQYQNARAGDFWRFTPKNYIVSPGPGMYVMAMKPNENLLICFGLEGKPPEPCGGTWQFVLRQQSDGTTRLILRARNPGEPGFGAQVGKLFEVITFTMQRGMLLGFRDRIEAAK